MPIPYTLEFIHNDPSGSPNVISKFGGRVAQRMAWDVYGRRRNPTRWWDPSGTFTNATNVTVGFTGHRLPEDNVLIWMESRHYDPIAGRFMKPDTIIPDQASTQGWSRYVYVENDPVNYVDPSGHRRHEPGNVQYFFLTLSEAQSLAAFYNVDVGMLIAAAGISTLSGEFMVNDEWINSLDVAPLLGSDRIAEIAKSMGVVDSVSGSATTLSDVTLSAGWGINEADTLRMEIHDSHPNVIGRNLIKRAQADAAAGLQLLRGISALPRDQRQAAWNRSAARDSFGVFSQHGLRALTWRMQRIDAKLHDPRLHVHFDPTMSEKTYANVSWFGGLTSNVINVNPLFIVERGVGSQRFDRDTTIVHEVAHLVWAGGDFAYGEAANRLTESNPALSRVNADNLGYFTGYAGGRSPSHL